LEPQSVNLWVIPAIGKIDALNARLKIYPTHFLETKPAVLTDVPEANFVMIETDTDSRFVIQSLTAIFPNFAPPDTYSGRMSSGESVLCRLEQSDRVKISITTTNSVLTESIRREIEHSLA
jgi:hypothetical protein